jgi:hypothetical protein
VDSRAIVLTFRPTRPKADALAEAELPLAFREIGKPFHGVMSELEDRLPELRR